jgi:hypothetical protein
MVVAEDLDRDVQRREGGEGIGISQRPTVPALANGDGGGGRRLDESTRDGSMPARRSAPCFAE